MGLSFSVTTVLVVTVLWGLVPGAAADSNMPGSIPGFDPLTGAESPFTAFANPNVHSFLQNTMSSASRGPPIQGGTVNPSDLWLQPLDTQFMNGPPSVDSTLQTPSSSAPSGYIPAQRRRDTSWNFPQGPYLTEANVQHQNNVNDVNILTPQTDDLMAAYNQGTYHPGDRMMAGAGRGERVVVESHTSTSRRMPNIRNGYRCDECGSLFDRQRDLNLHARTHNPQQSCPVCSRRFVSKREVVRHVDSVHQNTRPYQCDTCTSAFARKDNLDRHVATVHRGRRRNAVVVHNRVGSAQASLR